MESSCEQEFHAHSEEDPGAIVIHGNEMENEVDSALNSSFEDVSDDEISTKKERHWRLGPENLNDTLLYDFPSLRKLMFCYLDLRKKVTVGRGPTEPSIYYDKLKKCFCSLH